MTVFGILLCVIFAGFFSGMEAGLVAANQMIIYAKRERKRYYARAAHFLLHKPDRLLATTLIGTNLVVVTATVLLIDLIRTSPLPSFAEWIGVFGLTIVLLVFGEIVPKSFFRNYADSVTLRFAPVLVVFYFLFLPVGFLLNSLINFILLLFGKRRQVKKLLRSREDLRLLLKLRARELSIPAHDQQLIDDLFNFPDTKAREVMIPLNRTPVCALATPLAEVIKISMESGARFLPVYSKRSDNIVGYIDVEDFLCGTARTLKGFLHEAVFFPETKRIPSLLLSMNQKNHDLVFLCDEYGLISGVITAKEIISDIVGHIPGENDDIIEEEIRAVSPNRFIVLGVASIDDCIQKTGIQIEKGGYDTIGGFLCEKLGEIPKIGTVYTGKGVVFRVLERDQRQIKKVEIQKIESEE